MPSPHSLPEGGEKGLSVLRDRMCVFYATVSGECHAPLSGPIDPQQE